VRARAAQQFKISGVVLINGSRCLVTRAYSIHLWFKASELDNVTATDTATYGLRPADRGLLEYKCKRLDPLRVAKLYTLHEVLKVARAIHFPSKHKLHELIEQAKFLGLPLGGSVAALRRRVLTRVACLCAH